MYGLKFWSLHSGSVVVVVEVVVVVDVVEGVVVDVDEVEVVEILFETSIFLVSSSSSLPCLSVKNNVTAKFSS